MWIQVSTILIVILILCNRGERKQARFESSYSILLQYFVGLNILAYFLATQGKQFQLTLTIWNIVFLFYVASVWIFRTRNTKAKQSNFERFVERPILPLFILSLATLPILGVLAIKGAGGGYITIGNQDVVQYALATENFRQSGFYNSGHVSWANYGAAAKMDVNGSYTFLAWCAETFGLQTWQAIFPSLVCALGLLLVSIKYLTYALVGQDTSRYVGLSYLVILTGSITYLAAQYFLSSILSLAAILTLVAFIIRTTNFKRNRLQFSSTVTAALAAVFAIQTHPAFGILATGASVIALVLIAARIHFDFKTRMDHGRVAWKHVALFVAISGICSHQVIGSALALAELQSRSNLGWEIQTLSSAAAVISPLFIYAFTTASPLLLSFSWLALLGFIFWVVVQARTNGPFQPSKALILASISIAGIGCGFVTLRYGYSSYQSWKAILFLVPILLAVTSPLIVDATTALGGRRLLITGVGILCLAPLAFWAVAANSTVWPTLTTEMQDMTQSDRIQSADIIKLRLDPNFETNAVANLINSSVRLVDSNIQENTDSNIECTLTNKSRLSSKDRVLEKINDKYYLIQNRNPSTLEKCSK